MDTSNSAKAEVLEGGSQEQKVISEQPIPVDPITYIRFGLKVPAEKVSAEGWMKTIQEVLDIYKPYMDYFPYIQDHNLPFAGGEHGVWRHRFDCEDGKFTATYTNAGGSGIYDKTRLLPVLSISSARAIVAGVVNKVVIKEKFLLVTTKGIWVELKRTLESAEKAPDSYFPYIAGLHYSGLGDVELTGIINENKHLGPAIVTCLNRLASLSIETKEMRLHRLKNAREIALEIEGRIY